jgi:predicted MFS family arabinose efflux permease
VAGGIISDTVGWPFIFLVNIPVGLVVIAVLTAFMPKARSGQRRKVDYPGGLLLAAGVTLTVFWAEEVLGGGASGPITYVLPILTVVALGAFVWVERRAAEPVVPLHLLQNRTIAIVLSVSVLAGVVTLGMLNYFALFLQVVTGLPPALAGLLFLPASVGSLIASIGSGMLISRSGRYKVFPVLAMAMGVAVMLTFTLVDGSTPLVAIAGLMFLFSFSIGLQMQTLMVAVQAAAPPRDIGAATGLIGLVRMIGASLGLAANGGLLTAALVRGQAALDPAVAAQLPGKVGELTPGVIDGLPEALRQAAVAVFSGAFNTVFLFGAGIFAVAFVLTLLLKDVRLPAHRRAASGPVGKG